MPSADKYCRNGGMAFAPRSRTDANRRQLWGSMIGTFGPLYGPSEVADLQGNRLELRGPTRLGAQMSSSGLCLARTSTAATGAWPSLPDPARTQPAGSFGGPVSAALAPSTALQKLLICRGIA